MVVETGDGGGRKGQGIIRQNFNTKKGVHVLRVGGGGYHHK